MNEWFHRFATRFAEVTGSPGIFVLAIAFVLTWAVTGPLFHFSNTWQLVVNTVTNIVEFIMVFLIQNTQNREAKAIHVKLDELLRGVKGARTSLVDVEESSEKDLDTLQKQFRELHSRLHHGESGGSTLADESPPATPDH